MSDRNVFAVEATRTGCLAAGTTDCVEWVEDLGEAMTFADRPSALAALGRIAQAARDARERVEPMVVVQISAPTPYGGRYRE